MMPVHPGTWLAYAFAVLAGFGFGFVLENAGFGSSRKLAGSTGSLSMPRCLFGPSRGGLRFWP